MYNEGRYRFAKHIIEEGDEMRNFKIIMTIQYKGKSL